MHAFYVNHSLDGYLMIYGAFTTDSDKMDDSTATSPLESNKYTVNPGITCLGII